MRWWFFCALLGAAMFVLTGCPDQDGVPGQQSSSILVFRYDAVRDVVITSTYQLSADTPITAQRYANALAALPEVSYTPTAAIRLANPLATVVNDVLTVNYRDVAGLQQLSSAQAASAVAAFEAWRWVPGVREVRLQAAGQPMTILGPLVITQPLQFGNYTYVVNPTTGEVAYLVGSLNPATIAQAVTILQQREIRELPAQAGLRPLLPVGVTISANPAAITTAGVLTVNLSANFPREETARLAGIVLMMTQFPTVNAVQFTFGGQTVNAPFMRSNLNAPIRPYDLLLPLIVASAASVETTAQLQAIAEKTLGRKAEVASALVWQDLALLTTDAQPGTAPQTVALRKMEQDYVVLGHGVNLSVVQLLQQGVPQEAITAFRLPGWENFELAR